MRRAYSRASLLRLNAASIMSVAALLSLALGVTSDLLRTNRILLEEQLEQNQGDAIPPTSAGAGGPS